MSSYVSTVTEAFEIFKSRLELDLSYEEIISNRHKAVRDVIKSSLGDIKTQLIGSLQRKTRIASLDGLNGFDIDILVELGAFYNWLPPGQGITCDMALNQVEKSVEKNLKYQKMGVYEDSPTIIIPYQDGTKVEIVPAYLDRIPTSEPKGRAYWIPKNGRWVRADYNYDASYISLANRNSDDRLIPIIKMLKSWRRHRVPNLLRSFHLEVLAAAIVPQLVGLYKKNKIELTWPFLITSFFELAAEEVLRIERLLGSLSESAIYYLSDTTKVELVGVFQRTAKYLQETLQQQDSSAIKRWHALFGEPFTNN